MAPCTRQSADHVRKSPIWIPFALFPQNAPRASKRLHRGGGSGGFESDLAVLRAEEKSKHAYAVYEEAFIRQWEGGGGGGGVWVGVGGGGGGGGGGVCVWGGGLGGWGGGGLGGGGGGGGGGGLGGGLGGGGVGCLRGMINVRGRRMRA